MDRPLITVPTGFLAHLQFDWDIDWRGQSMGSSTTGLTRTVFSGYPRWIGSPQVFLDRTTLGQWRAIRAAARGRVGIYRVRMVDPAVFTRAAVGGTRSELCAGKPTAQSNMTAQGNGTFYEPFALASGSFVAGASTIRVDVSSCNGVAPKVGQIMSHDDWPFTVRQVLPVSGTVYEIGIEMPLRSAITDGDAVLMQGVGRFEATDETMGRPSYGAGGQATVSLGFQEVLAR